MQEAIEQVLNDETLTTNEERVKAITTALGTLVFPKDKFNDLNTKYQTLSTNYSALEKEFEDFKKSKMTDEEKAKAEKETLEADKLANAKTKSELAVKMLLLDNGIKITDDDVELKETLENIISEDYDKSIKLANNFISLLNKTKENTAKETTTQLLNDTPKPIGGSESSSNPSKLDELNQQYKDAVESKDVVAQTKLMTAIFNEQQKLKTNI